MIRTLHRSGLTVLPLAGLSALAQAATIMVVRHAERNAGMTPDLLLSPQGEERARELARALRDANIRAIFTTEVRRTQQTAEPTGIAGAADQPTVRAALQPATDRKAAPEFALKDSSGKTVKLESYRGKVVLLDFWATWCHGCKEEIPWFSEFERRYSGKGLRVIGVSLDDEGWKVIQPFLETAKVPYRMILGDDPTAKKYGIDNMPDAFLIDREGRIAAAYVGLVDKDDVETNIRTMLSQR